MGLYMVDMSNSPTYLSIKLLRKKLYYTEYFGFRVGLVLVGILSILRFEPRTLTRGSHAECSRYQLSLNFKKITIN